VSKRVGALLVGGEGLFFALTNRIIALTARYRLPASYPAPAAEGLMSYGTDFPDLWRQVGVYAGRILNGEIPGDLPVQQVTKVNLVINLKTAKALGLTVPNTLLALADEVIE
jgi:putative ABC transport system substrate-binding protein